MRIREYTSADFHTLRRMHAAQGFGYPLPDLDSPIFVTKLVLEEDEDGGREESGELLDGKSSRVVMAVLLRLTAEAYLVHDPDAGTPRDRWRHFLALHGAALQHAAARGLDDAQAFLPPRVAKSFGRRLARLGWRPDPWTCFSRQV